MEATVQGRKENGFQGNARLFLAGADHRRSAELTGWLEELGYSVEEASRCTPAATLRRVARKAPQVVLMDLDEDPSFAENLEVAVQVRSFLNIPVVLICDKNRVGAIPPEALSLPHGYLVRPLAEIELVRMIDTALYIGSLEERCRTARDAFGHSVEDRKTFQPPREVVRSAQTARLVAKFRESEEKFRTLAEACPFAILIYQDDHWVYANTKAEAVSGYRKEELFRMRFWEIVHPDHRPLVRKRGLKRQRGEKAQATYDFRIIDKSGKAKWVSLSGDSFLYDGRPAGLITIIDITERKRAESELLESKRRMSQIIEFLPDATFGIDADGRVIIWNRAMEEMTGIEAEAMMGKAGYAYAEPFYGKRRPVLANRILDGITDGTTPFYRDAVQQGRSLTIEIFCPALYRGKGAFVFAKAAPLMNGSGNIIGAIESVRDISERVRAEEELRGSEEKYRTILENIVEGYYEVDLHGTFIFFNDFICRISGYTREEIREVNYREYTSPEEAEILFSAFHEVYLSGEPVTALELPVTRKDGGLRHVEMSASLIRNSFGEAEGFRGIIRDITDRKKAEEQKRDLEAQLQQAHKMEAIGTLAGGVAHDFNNILQAISGYTQLLLLKKNADHPDHQKLQQIQEAGNRAASLIEQLLTFSRKIEGQCRLLCLNQEIRLVEQLLKQTIPKMIDRQLDLDENLWPVNADPVHMEQILLNLGSNAADAMPEGGLLRIATQNVELNKEEENPADLPPGPYIRLSVSDTGCGMDPKTLEQIFDPFFTTKSTGKGTGLGLASVYGIVKNHGGHIMCKSRPHRGSRFEIYLPALPDAVQETMEKRKTRPPEGGTETILVVDDECPVRETAEEILRYFGYRVLSAEDGETALEIYGDEEAEIDLVILDLNMPGMGGIQCLRLLLERDPAARIIISSGYTAGHLPRDTLPSTSFEFISKPYQAGEFAALVRRVLDER